MIARRKRIQTKKPFWFAIWIKQSSYLRQRQLVTPHLNCRPDMFTFTHLTLRSESAEADTPISPLGDQPDGKDD